MESIHDLYAAVRNHPDYLWGVVFTKEDVRDLSDDRDDLTDAHYDLAAKRVAANLMEGAYDWTNAIEDAVSEVDEQIAEGLS